MSTESKSFETNFRKLEMLSADLQDNKVTIDALIPRMQEALAAIKVCKSVLKETKVQLKEISLEFADIEANPAADES